MINKYIKTFFHEFSKESRFSNLFKSFQGAIKNYKRSNSALWTNSLCYFSILSLVPILAILFSLGKLLGIDEFIANQLYKNSPLNKQALTLLLDAAQNLLLNTKSGLLAGIGFFILIWIVISMFTIIEKALNNVWRIKKSRNFQRKFSDYISIFLIFLLTLLFMSIFSGNNKFFITFPKIIKIIIPYISLWIFFIFFYKILPNTYINTVPAIIASFIVALLFNQSNLIFYKLQSLIIAYNKIYGSFSIVFIFIIWNKIIWFIILMGAHLMYVLQHSERLGNIDGIKYLNFTSRSKMSVIIVIELTQNFIDNNPPLSEKDLANITKFPIEMISDILQILRECCIVVEISNAPDYIKYYKLCINYELLTIRDILEFVSDHGDNFEFSKHNLEFFENENTKIVDLILPR